MITFTRVLRGFAAALAALAALALIARGMKVIAPAVLGLWLAAVMAAISTEIDLLREILDEIRKGKRP